MHGDERIRDLERRWRTSGAAEDEQAYLLARLRAGRLAESEVRLAAFLGHDLARRVLGLPRPATPASLRAWLYTLTALGPVATLRVAAAATNAALGRWDGAHPDDPRPRRALAEAEAWVRCPCLEHARRARQAEPAAVMAVTSALDRSPDLFGGVLGAADRARDAARAAADLVEAVWLTERYGLDRALTSLEASLAAAARAEGRSGRAAVIHVRHVAAEEVARAMLQDR